MEIRTLSNNHGILSIYNGEKYIIYSTFYGVVAESTKIDRSNDYNTDKHKVIIDFDICNWSGYWDLKPIITKGINKAERQFIEDKKVIINYNTIYGTDNALNKRLDFTLTEYNR